jgi:hypothetical protein
VIYRFSQPKTFRVYAGQQLDAYIQANPLPDPGAARGGKS